MRLLLECPTSQRNVWCRALTLSNLLILIETRLLLRLLLLLELLLEWDLLLLLYALICLVELELWGKLLILLVVSSKLLDLIRGATLSEIVHLGGKHLKMLLSVILIILTSYCGLWVLDN